MNDLNQFLNLIKHEGLTKIRFFYFKIVNKFLVLENKGESYKLVLSDEKLFYYLNNHFLAWQSSSK